ncbi:MAG: hypothetical protein GF416_07615 [Candidatus Altiarchaeales archaeon]|nr:hypothetical protein [Candidatus Altiarchaeales archaeon]MBD3416979.1 hypothetical protein [Candidatus Altiarchaeales archaeon]
MDLNSPKLLLWFMAGFILLLAALAGFILYGAYFYEESSGTAEYEGVVPPTSTISTLTSLPSTTLSPSMSTSTTATLSNALLPFNLTELGNEAGEEPEVGNDTVDDEDDDGGDGVSHVLLDCLSGVIVYEAGTVDCGEHLICDDTKIGKSYASLELMLYDTCISDVYTLPEPDALKECGEREDIRFRELCYINLATEKKNLRICEMITQDNYMDMCVARVAVASEDIGLCYKVEDHDLMSQCLLAIKIIWRTGTP